MTPASPLEVVQIAVLSDNYAWLVHDRQSGRTVAIDPGEAQPVLDAAAARGWSIDAIWNTHWHPDHVGGNAAIKAATGAEVTGPAAEAGRIATLDHGVAGGDTLSIGAHVAQVIDVPGHTAGHVAFHFADDGHVFSGDSLFAMGCGRLFEGTADDMYRAMRRFDAMADSTRLWCGHEYTLANARFAAHANPGNPAIADRLATVTAMRDRGEPTIPSTIGAERATNPFLRAKSPDELGRLRAAKDAFTG